MNNKAQALVEYILIVAIMSILIITLLKAFSGNIKDAITKAGCNIGGLEYVAGDKAGQGSCQDKKTEDLLNEDK